MEIYAQNGGEVDWMGEDYEEPSSSGGFLLVCRGFLIKAGQCDHIYLGDSRFNKMGQILTVIKVQG